MKKLAKLIGPLVAILSLASCLLEEIVNQQRSGYGIRLHLELLLLEGLLLGLMGDLSEVITTCGF